MNDQIMAILKIVSPKGVENTLIDILLYFSKDKSQDLIAHFLVIWMTVQGVVWKTKTKFKKMFVLISVYSNGTIHKMLIID